MLIVHKIKVKAIRVPCVLFIDINTHGGNRQSHVESITHSGILLSS